MCIYLRGESHVIASQNNEIYYFISFCNCLFIFKMPHRLIGKSPERGTAVLEARLQIMLLLEKIAFGLTIFNGACSCGGLIQSSSKSYTHTYYEMQVINYDYYYSFYLW